MSLIEGTILQTGSSDRFRQSLMALHGSVAFKDSPKAETTKVVVEGKRLNTVVRSVPESLDFADRVFSSLVSLKVAVSQYAMHLSSDERQRIFAELDSVINTEDWHEEDKLPHIGAFKDFLKWMIYSKYNKWISIGVSDDGFLTVAWKTERVLLTALFSGQPGQEAVRWTVQITSQKGEKGYTVGRCPLRLFSEQALFYLRGADIEAEQHR